MLTRGAAAASEAVADAAANQHLAEGGGAVDAVLAGVFAAGGETPGVLLGPASILIAGVGQGARVFDGRTRQPGLRARRPRGFVESEPIPDAARVGAPAALSAIFVAHAYGRSSLRSILEPGIISAQRANASERASFLERLAQVGAGALSDSLYRSALLRVAAPSERGQLTPADLEPPIDLDVPALERSDGPRRITEAPWAADQVQETESPGRGAFVAAVDVDGLLAAVTFRVAQVGVLLEELGLLAPLCAIPVCRGVPRVSPGTSRPSPAPAAVHWGEAHRWVEVIVEPESLRLDLARPANKRWTLRRDSTSRVVECRID